MITGDAEATMHSMMEGAVEAGIEPGGDAAGISLTDEALSELKCACDNIANKVRDIRVKILMRDSSVKPNLSNAFLWVLFPDNLYVLIFH